MTAAEEAERAPKVGTLVVDVRRERIGEVMALTDGRLALRPPAGGREWEAFPCDVRPGTAGDELRAKVTEVNGLEATCVLPSGRLPVGGEKPPLRGPALAPVLPAGK